MAISIDWGSRVIYVPRNDMVLVQASPEIRELNITDFHLELILLEESEEGMAFPITHINTAPIDIGGTYLARVFEIINGYTITFEDGQYAVNLVGANSNIGNAVNVNSVSVRSSNSVGLTYSKEIENQAFYDSRIFIDTLDGNIGNQYPMGTLSYPVNSYNDALSIQQSRFLAKRFLLKGSLTLPENEIISNFDWLGLDPLISHIELIGPSSYGTQYTTNTIFSNLSLTGSGGGIFALHNGAIKNFEDFEANLKDSSIGGTLTLPSAGSSHIYELVNCFSEANPIDLPTIDFNNATDIQMYLRDYTGELRITNFSSPDNLLVIDLTSGYIEIDNSVIDGTIIIRGTGSLVDNSFGGTIINNLTPIWTDAEKNTTLAALTSITDATNLLLKYQENRTVIDKLNNTLTVYDDDGVTPILTFTLLNSLGSPSTDEVAERVPV